MARRTYLLAAGLSLAALLAAGRASADGGAGAPAPPPPLEGPAAGLLVDLEKMIESQESLGWTIDRYEYEEVLPAALMSVCSTTPSSRQAVLSHLEREIAALGGPLEEAFRRSGGDIDEVSDLLFVTRVRTLLEEALRRAPAECPFWLRPSATFHGLQTDAYRYTVNFESGGVFVLQSSDKARLGGGGSGRLLLGRGFSPSFSFLTGVEFGGHALFEQTQTETLFPISFLIALPVVLRHNDLTWHYDMELAPIAYFTQADTRVSLGLRAGGLIGISTLRIRNIMPWAGVGAAFEYVFDSYVRPAHWAIKVGARVGFDWDF